MATHCRYCNKELPTSDGYKRVICGSTVCQKAAGADYMRRRRAGTITPRPYTRPPDHPCVRSWGELTIPDRQETLNKAMHGQVVYCPNCGAAHAVTQDQRVSCVCRAIWTVSWGSKPNGDVVVARIDRWR